MLISLLLIAIITSGGIALSYIFDDDAPLMWRIAAGNILGCAVFGTSGFVLALLFGLNVATALGGLLLAMLPPSCFYRAINDAVCDGLVASEKQLQGANTRKPSRLAYYGFFFLLFFSFFFDRAMLESAGGIFTGGSQNLGRLPFHLGAVLSFTEE